MQIVATNILLVLSLLLNPKTKMEDSFDEDEFDSLVNPSPTFKKKGKEVKRKRKFIITNIKQTFYINQIILGL